MRKQKSEPSLAPVYPHVSIRGLASLSKALGIHKSVLIRCASMAEGMYRVAKQETKSDGSIRQTFDAYPRLKGIQIKIKERLLQRVVYPSYLHGSLRGRSPRTNAGTHVDAKITFAEDISNFFPSTSQALVQRVWMGFFGFSEDVAQVLTMLTTKDGGLPQGAVTSSYLANLAFWDCEPNLVKNFYARGLKYSRYVDDVTVSSKQRLVTNEMTYVVSQVYGMLLHHGFKPKRSKHEITTAGRSMRTTKLTQNQGVGIPVEKRRNVRAAVFALEKLVASGERGAEVTKELARVSTKVGRLGSYHQSKAAPLKKRLDSVRALLKLEESGVVSLLVRSNEPQPYSSC